MRRFFLILPIILLAVIVGIGLYFLFSPAKTTTTGTGTTGTLPAAGTQSNPGGSGASSTNAGTPTIGKNLGIISNEPILEYFVSPNNNVTAIEPSGKIIQVLGGQMNVVNTLTIQNIISASFSYDGSKILVNFGDPTNPQTSVFDTGTKAWTPLAQGMISPIWSPSDYRIAYLSAAANGLEAIATIDASKQKPAPATLYALHAQDLTVAWPFANTLVLSTRPSAYAAGMAWDLNLRGNLLTPIEPGLFGLELLWQNVSSLANATSSPMALAFSETGSNSTGALSLINLTGITLEQLKFLTLPIKCAFAADASTTASSYLFCGIPRDQNALNLAHLPDDYIQNVLYTSDDIYRINIANGNIDVVFNDQTQNLDISDVRFFNNMLFFVNRYDEKLYAITISTGA